MTEGFTVPAIEVRRERIVIRFGERVVIVGRVLTCPCCSWRFPCPS